MPRLLAVSEVYLVAQKMACFTKWTFNVSKWSPNVSDLNECLIRVTEEDKERIRKFRFRHDAISCLIGRLMIRKFASNLLAIDNKDLVILRNDKGRPYIGNELTEDMKRADFNVTHQGEYVCFVGTANGPVGVDVMEFEERRSDRREEFFRLMKRQFSNKEWNYINTALPYCYIKPGYAPQLATFYRLWALKESYVKAIGIGIGFDLQRISFQLNDFSLSPSSYLMNTKLTVDGESVGDFVFEEGLLDESHVVAVARRSDCLSTGDSFVNVNFEDLIESLQPVLEADEGFCAQLLSKD